MTVIRTGISWTRSTWNPTAGCSKVSPGCDNCYAAAMFTRTGLGFGHAFTDLKLHPERLEHVKRFRPYTGPNGRWLPHLVFVNSISDLMHDAIPDDFVHRVFDAMETQPKTIFQTLTKRPVRLRQFLVARYGNRGVPTHIWIGVSCEDNRVAKRLDILRSIKDRTGGEMTAFVSVEPIIGKTDEMDFSGLSWVITGGESGGRARIMRREWLLPVLEKAASAGAALWHKQSGQIASHPNIGEAPAQLGPKARFQWLVENGWEHLPDEKGGATVDKRTYREFPPPYHRLAATLNPMKTLI